MKTAEKEFCRQFSDILRQKKMCKIFHRRSSCVGDGCIHLTIWLICYLSIGFSEGQLSCLDFLKIYKRAQQFHEINRFNASFTITENDIGYDFISTGPNHFDISTITRINKAEALTLTARFIDYVNKTELDLFGNFTKCFEPAVTEKSPLTKYRPINGYGANVQNPHWGTPLTSFGRLVAKNFDDGIHSVRKSVSGSSLPSPRHIVNEIYVKMKKEKRPPLQPNTLLNLLVLYVSHDLGQQFSTKANDGISDIRCCGSGNQSPLPPTLSHHACLPVKIPKNDEFYSKGNVKCLNMARSQVGSAVETIQAGEIMNKVTAYLDHSGLYGNDESDTNKIRTFYGGKLNTGAKNLYPVDNQGKHLEILDNLVALVTSTVWPVIFARLHNYLAEGLAAVNPSWNDEKLFQEARRINIAMLQKIIYGGKVIENLSRKSINETYDENSDISTSVEFITAAYRFFHVFVTSDAWMVDSESKVTKIPQSDLIEQGGHFEGPIDDLIRGASRQPINYDFTEELRNKLFKNQKGFGIDLFAIDIQRGRDHGLPTFLEMRKRCELPGDFKSFNDLIAIFPQSYIDLLKGVYTSVEDIDLIVGSALESFTTFDTLLVGATISCMILEQYKRVMRSDPYFYLHKTSPHPFTDAQLKVISEFTVGDMLCKTTKVEWSSNIWFLVEAPTFNPKILCTDAKLFDFTAFLNI